MRAQHRYQIMLAMASRGRKPLHETVTQPGDYDEPGRPQAEDSTGEAEPVPTDCDVGTMECSHGDCGDLPELDASALRALEPSEAEPAFSPAPTEITFDGMAI
ncbi:MAG: hypothetical protein FJ090_11130 [Deltaproteobacteria bacterium]|nr:hypothetical protein [Deltaproteobacteria bacterium]